MRIIFVTPRFPWPLTKGDQLRAYHQVKDISKHHEVILFSLSEEAIPDDWIKKLSPFCIDIKVFNLSKPGIFFSMARRIFSGLPFQNTYHYNNFALQELKRLYDMYQPEKMIFQLVRMAPYAAFFPKEKCIVDLMDCLSYHYLLRSKHSEASDQWFYNIEYRRLKKYESKIINRYENVLVISEKDKELMPGNSAHLKVVGNGVDIPPVHQANKSTDLLFLGNLSYTPNIIAADFLANEVLPLIRKTKHEIKLTIAGMDPGKKIRNMASESIFILANVEDTSNVFGSARIFLAPMFLSTGIQNKILEAMAARVPVITTPNAADAIGAIDGKEVLTAISAQEFADKILHLLQNEKMETDLINNAFDMVRTRFNWSVNNQRLIELL